MKDFSYITNSHPSFIENLYQDYTRDPNSVDQELRKFFEGFDFAISSGKASSNGGSNGQQAAVAGEPGARTTDGVDWKKELGAYRMILGYRNKGHLEAKTNPIRPRKDRGAQIDIGFYGFTEEDLKKNFFAGNLIGLGTTTLENILNHLKQTYSNHVGIEFKYISDQKKVNWLTHEMEKNFQNPLPLEKNYRNISGSTPSRVNKKR